MNKLESFLVELLANKDKVTNASSGKGFEEQIKNHLKKHGFSEMVFNTDEEFDDYLQNIKPIIQAKTGDILLNNNLYLSCETDKKMMYRDCFVWQPYGSQSYPDFLVFTEYKVFSVETKYSTKSQGRPVWNGNLPKKDGIYIFGSYGKRDLTIFRGEDVLPEEERCRIVSVWDYLDKPYAIWEDNFKKLIGENELSNEYGFKPSIRKAYEQSQTYNEFAILDYFHNKNRSDLEQSVLHFVSESDTKS